MKYSRDLGGGKKRKPKGKEPIHRYMGPWKSKIFTPLVNIKERNSF